MKKTNKFYLLFPEDNKVFNKQRQVSYQTDRNKEEKKRWWMMREGSLPLTLTR